jgi:hypothetical protein
VRFRFVRHRRLGAAPTPTGGAFLLRARRVIERAVGLRPAASVGIALQSPAGNRRDRQNAKSAAQVPAVTTRQSLPP